MPGSDPLGAHFLVLPALAGSWGRRSLWLNLVAVPGRRRDQLEKVCRYILRPPLAVERLTESTGGQLLYHFRRPWRDGSTALGRPRLFVDPAGRVPGLISPTSRRLAGSSAARYTPPTAMTRRLTVMT